MATRPLELRGTVLLLVAALVSACDNSSDDDAAGGGGSATTSSQTSAGTMSTSATGNTSSSTTTVASSSSTGGTGMGTCAMPYVVADPSIVTGDTTGAADALAGSCQFGGTGEAVYAFTPSITGTLHITLEQQNADLGVYVQTTCGSDTSEIGCSDQETTADEVLDVDVTQGETVYVVVDGFEDGREGPFTLKMKTVVPMCGDGIHSSGEDCDPPDMVTCSATCTFLPEDCDDGFDNDLDDLIDCEDDDCVAAANCPNGNVCATAPVLTAATTPGTTVGGSAAFAGSCTGSTSPERVYQFTPPASGLLILSLSAATDLGLYVRTTCNDTATEAKCVDTFGGNGETLVTAVTSGAPAFIFVDSADAADAGSFSLTRNFVPFNEMEPNGTFGEATTFNGPPYIAGITPSLDEDWIAIDVPGPASSLMVQVDDLNTGECMNQQIDSELEIFGPDGMTSLAFNDDINMMTNWCSIATANGLAAGTYYVRVRAGQSAATQTFNYRIFVTIT